MPSSYLQGIQTAFDNQAQIANDVAVVSTNWFVNRCPLITRTPRVPVGSTVFTIVSRGFRPRVATLAAPASATDFQLTLADASPFMNGDVLELASGERVEINGDPNAATNTIVVRRAVEGTTAAPGAANDTIRLISNSRTGAEINQSAIARRPQGVAQYCQTWQHPVQVGGSLQASAGYQASPGLRTPFEQSKMDALQNLMDDMEVSSYYGRGEDPSVTARPKQKGLKVLLAANGTTAPTNAAAYRPTDFIRDTLEKARVGGGNPDVLLLSTNFMTGLAAWGQQVMRMDAGTNVFGMKIDVFEAPFLGGITIIEAPLLKPFTAVALTSSEVRMRMKRNEFWSPRGSRGDSFEGDWIAEGAIEVDNPSHHAWLEGVTAFSAN
ncbi:SU10 major capsid protein [Tundrisphaera sp. TA3]|uniref:SU10 major capsid protein n=1 Tax=Tundrisphaera sp. TA3 TaxID=3435775 RepID=UPI003EB7AEA7